MPICHASCINYTGAQRPFDKANGGSRGVINVARGFPGLLRAIRARVVGPMLSRKARFRWSRDGTDIINVSENNGGTMWEMPWLNRDCLELVRPAFAPRTDKGPSRETARKKVRVVRVGKGQIAPSSLDRSDTSNICNICCVCLSLLSPTPQGPGQRAERRGPEGPNTRFSRLSRNSLPVPLLQLCRCQLTV